MSAISLKTFKLKLVCLVEGSKYLGLELLRRYHPIMSNVYDSF